MSLSNAVSGSIINTRQSKAFSMHVAAKDARFPFNPLLIVEVTKRASVTEILQWINNMLEPLQRFKTEVLEDHERYRGLWDMLAFDYRLRGLMYWSRDNKTQHKVVKEGIYDLRVTWKEVVTRQLMDEIESEMLEFQLPGTDLANSASNRQFKEEVMHNLLLTVAMDIQWPQSNYFQTLLGGPLIEKWSSTFFLHRRLFGEHAEGHIGSTSTSQPPPIPRKRVKKTGPRSGLGHRLKDKSSASKKPNCEIEATNGQFWENDSQFDPSDKGAIPPPEYKPKEDLQEQSDEISEYVEDSDDLEELSDGEDLPSFKASARTRKLKVGNKSDDQKSAAGQIASDIEAKKPVHDPMGEPTSISRAEKQHVQPQKTSTYFADLLKTM